MNKRFNDFMFVLLVLLSLNGQLVHAAADAFGGSGELTEVLGDDLS